MVNAKRKSKNQFVFGVIGLVLVAGLVVGPRLVMGNGSDYTEVVVRRGDIKTYYAFSGSVGSVGGDLQIPVKVDEYNLSSVEKGKEVSVTVNAIDRTLTGKITGVSDAAVNQGGIAYFTAMVDIPEDSMVKPGMTIEARIPNKSANDVLVVPVKVLGFDEDDKPYVTVRDDKGVPVRKPIKVGITDGMMVEVTKGLMERQVVLHQVKQPAASVGSGGIMPPIPGR